MKSVFGVIVGNRGFFPDELAEQGREDIKKVLEKSDCEVVCLSPQDTKFGSVETREDAKKCAELFRAYAERLDGIIVTLPNFGDERGVAETLRIANINLPVLIHATPDEPEKMRMGQRRDSFCGKISVCNNLVQYGISFSITEQHTMRLEGEGFRKELEKFKGVCRVVKGFRNVRVGAIGARPAAFNTVRYSEKILERRGISVEPIDLSEIFGRASPVRDSDERVVSKIAAIKRYCDTRGIQDKYILKMAKLGVIIDEFVKENDLDICAIQCWTSMEENYGVVPCTIMSMLSNSLVPSACEVDVGGALAMYALQLASGTPSAILDWNNSYGDEPDKCVLFHCSNTPKHFIENLRMDFQEIIAGSVGKEQTYGTCVGRIRSGPMTFARLTTNDENGKILTYVGEGRFTDDPLETFGGYGVAEVIAVVVALYL
jgi:L-fucose isomerase-like protein